MNSKEVLRNSSYFSQNENWGDIDKVDYRLLVCLELFRTDLGVPIHISPVEGAVYATSGHSDTSYHYIIPGRNEFCLAADIFPMGDLCVAFILALKYFNGVGVYPNWKMNFRNKLIKGGLHVDLRPNPYIWTRVGHQYTSITASNLKDVLKSLEIRR